HQRPQRRGRRRGGGGQRRAARAAGVVGERARHHRRAVRRLPDPARTAHPRRPPARAPGERAGDRRTAAGAPGGGAGALPGTGIAPRPCPGRAPAGRLRRDAVAGARGRHRSGARLRRRPAVLHPGRVAGRRREPGRAPGLDDPRGDDARGPRRGRHPGRAAAAVGRHRGPGRPAGGPRRGARAGRAGRRRGGPRAAAGGRMSKVTRIPTPAAGTRGGRIALLGTGVVGSAVVARYRQLAERGVALPPFAWLSNSRVQVVNDGSLEDALAQAHAAPRRATGVPPWAEGEALARGDIVIDATASDTVAGWHPEWLQRGIHVVTANKLGAGADATRAQAIIDAQREGGRYGDSATVGAGLPLL